MKLFIKIENIVNGRLADCQIDPKPLLNKKLSDEEVGRIFRHLIISAKRQIKMLK
jgi:hypothetical protein